ncbi:hypothetical protein JR316_0008355 [Psilocybe cubensis]|uniref:Uncharacterized protein n=2 Tax=Psilocybe cubensis TaxID=181762 RepID=A0ACB8GWB3_PSICU|nr:hypothetical protein JR316_0008355 [Psilocybe cubensis]KAH9479760.1 hypothetical protein JR316_0008355 [Psilocybe cubensis]
MLPSRLFRNTGIPPSLRSLITPHANLPSNVAVQLRLRLGVIPGTVSSASRTIGTNAASNTSSSSTSPSSSSKPTTKDPVVPPPPSASASESSTSATTTTDSQPLPEKIEPKLSLTFTCTVSGCGERSTHQFTKKAYEKGIVLVQCPGCKNRHLIADHLGWFKDSTQGGKLRTVEDILKEKGETVKRGALSPNGDVSYFE